MLRFYLIVLVCSVLLISCGLIKTPSETQSNELVQQTQMRSQKSLSPIERWMSEDLTEQENTAPLKQSQQQDSQAPKSSDNTENRIPERLIQTPLQARTQNYIKPKNIKNNQLDDSKADFTVSIENISIPEFINEIFGNSLNLSFEISPQLQKQADLITLRVSSPQTAAQLYELSLRVLNNYGVGIEKSTDLIRFIQSNQKAEIYPPLLVSGRNLPEVPNTHRTIFQLVPLKVARNTSVRPWLTRVFKGQELTILEEARRNMVILAGREELVQQALDAIEILDQPNMKGQSSALIQLYYRNADDIEKEVIAALNAEGYEASNRVDSGSVTVLKLNNNNKVLVFASDKQILKHVIQWIETLDRPDNTKQKKSIYFYQVKNTRAETLLPVLNEIISSSAVSIESNASSQQPADKITLEKTSTINNSKIVIDVERNALIFVGNAEHWLLLRQLLNQLDVPAQQVLIEINIAEIQLNDDENFGVEWLFKSSIGGYDGTFSTLGGLGVGTGAGFSFVLDSAGQTRAVINALQSDKRATVISSPRLMVQSGQEATMDVGKEIAILTSQQTSPDSSEGTNNLLNEVQYRKTGVILSIKPVVHSGERVDLQVSQEISDAQKNTTSNIDSPDINTRRVTTSLTLKDGGSVLLAGLVRDDEGEGVNKVPILGDIPIMGWLFTNTVTTHSRTELIILIRPYIVSSFKEAQDIKVKFLSELEFF